MFVKSQASEGAVQDRRLKVKVTSGQVNVVWTEHCTPELFVQNIDQHLALHRSRITGKVKVRRETNRRTYVKHYSSRSFDPRVQTTLIHCLSAEIMFSSRSELIYRVLVPWALFIVIANDFYCSIVFLISNPVSKSRRRHLMRHSVVRSPYACFF